VLTSICNSGTLIILKGGENMKAYKYRIYPKKAESIIIDETIEHCRLLYNRLINIDKAIQEGGRV